MPFTDMFRAREFPKVPVPVEAEQASDLLLVSARRLSLESFLWVCMPAMVSTVLAFGLVILPFVHPTVPKCYVASPK